MSPPTGARRPAGQFTPGNWPALRKDSNKYRQADLLEDYSTRLLEYLKDHPQANFTSCKDFVEFILTLQTNLHALRDGDAEIKDIIQNNLNTVKIHLETLREDIIAIKTESQTKP